LSDDGDQCRIRPQSAQSGRTVLRDEQARGVILPYNFRPVTREDLPRLRQWLRSPEAVRWWGDPAGEEELLTQDLDDPRMTMRIVSFVGRPFAYAQDYEVHAWPQPHLAHLPPGTRAIDTFIGEPDMVGRGHGAAYLRLLAMRLIAEGAPAVAIDPDVDNLRAQRAYEKAGFRRGAIVNTAEGLSVLMTLERSRL
jgi:aminoglycoside 6'-N-acetyltransferase